MNSTVRLVTFNLTFYLSALVLPVFYQITTSSRSSMAIHVNSAHTTKPDALATSQMQQSQLRYAGFTPNDEKCNWEAREIGEWLGMIINTITMCFQIPPSKIKKSKLLLKSASHLPKYCTRSWFHQFLTACSRICDPTFHKAFCHHDATSRMGSHNYSNHRLASRVPLLHGIQTLKLWKVLILNRQLQHMALCIQMPVGRLRRLYRLPGLRRLTCEQVLPACNESLQQSWG